MLDDMYGALMKAASMRECARDHGLWCCGLSELRQDGPVRLTDSSYLEKHRDEVRTIDCIR